MQAAGYAHSQLRAYRLAPAARKKPPFRILFGAMLDGNPSLILTTRGVFTASRPACPRPDYFPASACLHLIPSNCSATAYAAWSRC